MQELVFTPDTSIKVLVVGDIILDQYIYGETNRISPEAPVPVVRVNNTEERPGGAANVAINISSLGVSVALLGNTGKDDASQRLETILSERQVTCHFVQQEGFPTITKRRVLSQHQQLLRLDYEKQGQVADSEEILQAYREILESVDVVVLSDYAKGSLTRIEEFIEKARNKNIPVLVDPKSADFNCYRNANIITPNQKEFETIVGVCTSTEDLVQKADNLCRDLGLDALVVTRGENGMSLVRHDHDPLHLAAETHEVYDVTGAGDTVIAVLAAGIACGLDMEQATILANTAAGLVVEKLGAATVTVDELNNIKQGVTATGIVDKEALSKRIKQAKENNEKIVMTNGCFDILHAGHIAYLNQARELGDRLIIAVNDDDSVKRLKGDSRPINSLNSRLAVLNALACVDWVVPFSEDTPEQLITEIVPDILVKGGDYTVEQIAGAEAVTKSGGEVIVLPFQQNCSTSLMIEKIKDQKT